MLKVKIKAGKKNSGDAYVLNRRSIVSSFCTSPG